MQAEISGKPNYLMLMIVNPLTYNDIWETSNVELVIYSFIILFINFCVYDILRVK